VGSPAYAPRMTGPLQFPTQRETLFFAPQGYLGDGLEGKTFMADSPRIQTTESDKPQIPPATPPTVPDPSETAPPPEATQPLPGTPVETGAPVDLWDSGWPNGRYYWTVVAAEPRLGSNLTTYLSAPAHAFGKTNEPAVTTAGAPYVTGLSPTGRLVQATGARPAFYGSPLVLWKPALGADEYQVQWSPSRYPWRPVDPLTKERYEKLTF